MKRSSSSLTTPMMLLASGFSLRVPFSDAIGNQSDDLKRIRRRTIIPINGISSTSTTGFGSGVATKLNAPEKLLVVSPDPEAVSI